MKRHQIAYLIVLALLVLAPVQAEATSHFLTQLCAKINCPPVPIATWPKITAMSANSTFAPGGVVIVYGSGFGSTKRQFLLTGLKRYTGEGLKPVPLTIFEWHNTAVGGTIPSDITGVKDQPATLELKTATNQGSKGSIGVTVHFKATREVRPLQSTDPAVTYVSCGTGPSYDYCNGWFHPNDEGRLALPPGHTFYGFHSGLWPPPGAEGRCDAYQISLKNGWVLDAVLNLWQSKSNESQFLGWVAKCPIPGGIPDFLAAFAFPPGAVWWRPSVYWRISPGGSVWYGAFVSIIGPAGVPPW